MKACEKICHTNNNHKKAEMIILIPHKVCYSIKNITMDRDEFIKNGKPKSICI